MKTELVRQGKVADLIVPAPQAISNVVALFEALAVGWTDGSGRNRSLFAGDGRQFVRVNPQKWGSNFCDPTQDDIPIVVLNHAYSMAGFIQHETRLIYRGMFKTSRGDDGSWHSAQLTAAGYKFAQTPVFDVAHLHSAFAICSFFNPPTKAHAGLDLGMDRTPYKIGSSLEIGS